MKFVPNKFTPKEKDILWAMSQFCIDRKEVMRQFDLMKDHEFRRSYSCWDRVFRNWMRKADEMNLFRRERKVIQEEYTDEMREADAKKAWRELNRLKGV